MDRYRIETERADIFDINMTIVMSVSISGNPTREKLELAFEKAIRANQILNTRVEITEEGNAFYVENPKPQHAIYYSKQSVCALIREQEKKRFEIEKGEYLRVFVDDSAEVTKLHYFMHHLGGDGKSLCYFIEDFLRSLNGEELENKQIVTLTTENLPKKSGLPFWIKWYIKKCNRAWEKEKRVFAFSDLEQAHRKFWENNQTKVEFYEVSEAKLKEQLKLCRENGIGYTSLFIAELIKGEQTKQDVGLAVDGRLDKNRCMGNQATGISVQYKYDSSRDLLTNAIAINKAMGLRLHNQKLKYFILHFMAKLSPTLVDAVNLEHAKYFTSKTSHKLAQVLGYGEKTKDWSITNLTVIDIPVEYGIYHIEELVFIPPVISYGKNVIGLVTVNDRLYVSKHYYESI